MEDGSKYCRSLPMYGLMNALFEYEHNMVFLSFILFTISQIGQGRAHRYFTVEISCVVEERRRRQQREINVYRKVFWIVLDFFIVLNRG